MLLSGSTGNRTRGPFLGEEVTGIFNPKLDLEPEHRRLTTSFEEGGGGGREWKTGLYANTPFHVHRHFKGFQTNTKFLLSGLVVRVSFVTNRNTSQPPPPHPTPHPLFSTGRSL